MGFLVVGAAVGAECPPAVVKIKGPCPKEVVCSNLPAEKECPPCVCNPAPSVKVPGPSRESVTVPTACNPCPECRACPVVAVATPAGHWFTPVTLVSLPGWDSRVSYDEKWSHRKPEDPAFSVSVDRTWMLGAGVGYEWPSGWAVSGQAFRVFAPEVSARWTIKPGLVADDEGPILVSPVQASSPGDGWAYGLMVSIPWR